MRILLCLVLTAVLIPAAGRAASDWPQFGGPKRDAHSPDKGLLKAWPKGGPRLAWKAPGVGSGYSSVAVAGGKVFTLGNKGNTTFVVAIDGRNGKVLWSREVGPAGGDLGCTPTV